MDPSLLTLRSFQWLWGCPDFLLSTGIPDLLQVRSLLLLDPHLGIKNPPKQFGTELPAGTNRRDQIQAVFPGEGGFGTQ